MTRFWFSLLSLVLVLTCHATAFAVDVKFSGSFYVAGMYLDKTNFKRDSGNDGPGTAFYYQRLRIQTDFIVATGISLVTRFDALERTWGAQRSTPGTTAASQSAGTYAENENIAFDWVYMNFTSPIGTFRAGYMNDGAWGTVFMDTATPRGKVAWSNATSSWYYTLQIVKMTDKSFSATNPATTTDADSDKYVAAVKYTGKSGEAGLLSGMGRDATYRPAPGNFTVLFYTLQPYAIARIGPVKISAEFDYFWGEWPKNDAGVGNIKLENMAAFLDATADFGMFYVGGTAAFVSGDDPATTDKVEGNSLLTNGGKDWDPCLILFNNERSYWAGAIAGHGGSSNIGPMDNAWFFQGRGGFRPIAMLDIMASLSYATADKTPTGYVSKNYGYEIDVTANYKITNNLSYMLGVGYLLTGDYFKGTNSSASVANDYLVINKLTLSF